MSKRQQAKAKAQGEAVLPLEEDVLEQEGSELDSTPDAEIEEVAGEVLFSGGQVEDMASQLKIGSIVQLMKESQDASLVLFGQLEERIHGLEEQVEKYQEQVAELTDFAADSGHALARANGFPVRSEDVRAPDLQYGNLLDTLGFGNKHTLLNLNKKKEDAPVKVEASAQPAPTKKPVPKVRSRKRKQFVKESERIADSSATMMGLWNQ